MAKKTWADYEKTDITLVVNTLGEKLLVVDRKTFEIQLHTLIVKDIEGLGKEHEGLIKLLHALPDSAWERVTGLPLDVSKVSDGHPEPVLPFVETLDGEPVELQGPYEPEQDVQPEDLLDFSEPDAAQEDTPEERPAKASEPTDRTE